MCVYTVKCSLDTAFLYIVNRYCLLILLVYIFYSLKVNSHVYFLSYHVNENPGCNPGIYTTTGSALINFNI